MRPIGSRSATLVGLLAAHIVISLARVLVTLDEIELLERVRRGGFVTPLEAERSDGRVALVAAAFLLALVVTAVVWCTWQHRAHTNLRAAGRQGLAFTPGWAAGWWFVPVANLWKPYQSVRELWKASNPDVDGASWDVRRGWPVLGWWWTAWIVSNVLEPGAFQRTSGDSSIDAYITADYLRIVSDLVWIAAAALAIVIVKRVAARQQGLLRTPPVPPRIDMPGGGPPLPGQPGTV